MPKNSSARFLGKKAGRTPNLVALRALTVLTMLTIFWGERNRLYHYHTCPPVLRTSEANLDQTRAQTACHAAQSITKRVGRLGPAPRTPGAIVRQLTQKKQELAGGSAKSG